MEIKIGTKTFKLYTMNLLEKQYFKIDNNKNIIYINNQYSKEGILFSLFYSAISTLFQVYNLENEKINTENFIKQLFLFFRMNRASTLNYQYKLYIGGINFNIKDVENLDGYGMIGQINFDKTLISIDSKLSYENRFSTLIHEIIHGLIADIHNSFTDEEEENFVLSLEEPLTLFILNNGYFLDSFYIK